jgi:hypothetical protein
MVRRMEIRRIHIMRTRERMASINTSLGPDIFNPKAGVIYINMTDAVGRVEKASQSIVVIITLY